MKTLLLISLVLISGLALETPNCSAHQNLTEFSKGLFDYYDLELPTHMLRCFDEIHSQYLFSMMPVLKDYADSINLNNSIARMVLERQLEGFLEALNGTFHCAFETDDFSLFMSESGYRFASLEELINTIKHQIENNSGAGSRIVGSLIESILKEGFEKGGYYLGQTLDSLKAAKQESELGSMASEWFNGVSLGFNLPEPKNLIETCFRGKDEFSIVLLNFLTRWSKELGSSNYEQALDDTLTFFDTELQESYKQISKETWKCLKSHEDSFRFRNLTGFYMEP